MVESLTLYTGAQADHSQAGENFILAAEDFREPTGVL
jgi:hypothetical protein